MLFTSHELQSAAGYSDRRHFLQDYKSHGFPINVDRKVMETNRYRLLDMVIAMLVTELTQYDTPSSVCARLTNRPNSEYLEVQLDKLQAGEIDDLIIMIPALVDRDMDNFPTVATTWEEVIKYAHDEHINFFTISIGELIKANSKESGKMGAVCPPLKYN